MYRYVYKLHCVAGSLNSSQLPVDIDDGITDSAKIQDRLNSLSQSPSETSPGTQEVTGLWSFIQVCRLRQIESRMQRKIYGADRTSAGQTSVLEEIESFRKELDAWRTHTAQFSRSGGKAQKPASVYYDMDEFFNVQYSKALRMLLQPSLVSYNQRSSNETGASYLQLCARASGDICQSYKAMHQKQPLGWNLLAIHAVFTAGLNLLYCMWISRERHDLQMLDDIRACSSVLFVVAEHWPTARRFRDTFERMVSKMFYMLSKEKDRDADGVEDITGYVDNYVNFGIQDPVDEGYMMGNDNFWSLFDEVTDDNSIWEQFRPDANLL